MAPNTLKYQTRDLIEQAVAGARLAGLSIKTLKIDRQGKITVQMGPRPADCVDGDKGDYECDETMKE